MFGRSSSRFLSLVEARSLLGISTPITTLTPKQFNPTTSGASNTESRHTPFTSSASGESGSSTVNAPSSSSSKPFTPTILQILKEHYRTPDETLFATALSQLVLHDRTSIDSAMVAVCRVPATLKEIENGNVTAADTSSSTPACSTTTTQNVVVLLMRQFPDSVAIQEYGCRCIANMCLLSLPTTSSTPPKVDVAEELVEDGALLVVLKVLQLGNRLSRRGQGWAAMALLNLLCLSKSGASRCVSCASPSSISLRGSDGGGLNALSVISEFILTLLDETILLTPTSLRKVPSHSSDSFGSSPLKNNKVPTPSSLSGFPADLVTGVDAAVGALAILLQQETPENTTSARLWSDACPFIVIQAICKSVLLCSTLLVRDGRNDGVYSAALPQRREGLPFPIHQCSAHQSTAIIALLPWMHKNWIAIRLLSRFSANVPLIWEAFRALGEGKSEMVGTEIGGKERKHVSTSLAAPDLGEFMVEKKASGDEVKKGLAETPVEQLNRARFLTLHSSVQESSSTCSVTALLEASLFVVTELQGLESVQHLFAALGQIHEEICECMMEVFSIWTDVPALTLAAESTAMREEKSSDDMASSSLSSLSPHFSRPSHSSARLRLTTMGTGTVSSIALATVVRIHADACDARHKAKLESVKKESVDPSSKNTHQGDVLYTSPVPYDMGKHAMLLKGLETLHHLIAVRTSPAAGVVMKNSEEHSEEAKNSPSISSSDSADWWVTAADDVALSSNTLAALQVLLRTGAEVLDDVIKASLPSSSGSSLSMESKAWSDSQHIACIEELSYLFLPLPSVTKQEEGSLSPGSEREKDGLIARREAQSQLLLQEAAILGQVCSILFSFLQQERGARMILDDMVATASNTSNSTDKWKDVGKEDNTSAPTNQLTSQIFTLQQQLETYCGEALQKAKKRFMETASKVSSTTSSTSSPSWSVTRVEESVQYLTELFRGLLKSLQGLQNLSLPSRSMTFVNEKKE